MNQPKTDFHSFSVIIPTADREGLLVRALQCVARVVTPGTEVIVVNNGYNRPSESKLRAAIDGRTPLRLVDAPPWCGVSNARNMGGEVAAHDWLAFLDDDDEWTDGYLEVARRMIAAHPECDALLGRKDRKRGGEVIPYKVPDAALLNVKDMLWANACAGGSNVVVRRTAFKEVGGFDAKLPKREDRSFIMDLLRAGKNVVPCADLGVVSRDNTCRPEDSLHADTRQNLVRDIVFYTKYWDEVDGSDRQAIRERIVGQVNKTLPGPDRSVPRGAASLKHDARRRESGRGAKERRSASPDRDRVVELIGLPGAGKTTLVRDLMQRPEVGEKVELREDVMSRVMDRAVRIDHRGAGEPTAKGVMRKMLPSYFARLTDFFQRCPCVEAQLKRVRLYDEKLYEQRLSIYLEGLLVEEEVRKGVRPVILDEGMVVRVLATAAYLEVIEGRGAAEDVLQDLPTVADKKNIVYFKIDRERAVRQYHDRGALRKIVYGAGDQEAFFARLESLLDAARNVLGEGRVPVVDGGESAKLSREILSSFIARHLDTGGEKEGSLISVDRTDTNAGGRGRGVQGVRATDWARWSRGEDLVFFCVPFRPRASTDNWDLAVDLLSATLNSLLAQTCDQYRVLVCGHEKPDLEQLRSDRVRFIHASHPVSTDRQLARRDKQKKRSILADVVRRAGGGFLMPVDSDDLVHRDLVKFAVEENDPFGYLVSQGYILDDGMASMYRYPAIGSREFFQTCGTCAMFRVAPSDLPVVDQQGVVVNQKDCLYRKLKAHHQWNEVMEREGRPLRYIPFEAVVHRINHGVNISFDIVGRERRYEEMGDEMIEVSSWHEVLEQEFGTTWAAGRVDCTS